MKSGKKRQGRWCFHWLKTELDDDLRHKRSHFRLPKTLTEYAGLCNSKPADADMFCGSEQSSNMSMSGFCL